MKLYIDEAGRGPLAGPLHVGIVLPLKTFVKKDFKDSKKLSKKQREELFTKIQNLENKGSIIYSTGTVNNKEIDKLCLTKAINLAIQRGIFDLLKRFYQNYLKQNLQNGLCNCDIINMYSIENILLKKASTVSTEEIKQLIQTIGQTNPIQKIIIDGNHTFHIEKELEIPVETIIKGDDKVAEISMASIVAKVSRDERMTNIAQKKYPKYNFHKHKGYGTLEHRNLIKKNGPCEIHRKLFLRKIYGSLSINQLSK